MITKTSAQDMAQLVRDAIPTQLTRAAESCVYSRREYSMLESFLGKVNVRVTADAEITVRYPAWCGSRWQGYITALIDRAVEDLPAVFETGHILDRDATTTTFTW